jgi:hypothetical protein
VIRPAAALKRSLIFVHRWLGVALSVIFLLWFVSGIVMMYWTYPAVTPSDRLERAPVLDATAITASAAQASAVLGRDAPPAQMTIGSFDGRPVYRFGDGGRGGGGRGGPSTLVFADTGTEHLEVDDAMIDRAAATWAGRPVAEAKKEWVEEIDQWTVGGLRSQLPLHKYSWPDGQHVYVNGDSAEVVQYTTTASRFWAYLGAIPHWLYFTPLRRHQEVWFPFVVWSSLIGTIAALMGVVIAAWMYSPRQRYRHAGAPTSIPYVGWKRWHTIVGLIFGLVTTTWAFSGLLSMGPFPIMQRLTDLTVPAAPGGPGGGRGGRDGGRGAALGSAVRGAALPLTEYDAKPPAAAITALPGFGVKQLEYSSFAGQPLYVATNGVGQTRIVPIHGAPRAAFDAGDLVRRIRDAAGDNLAELRIIDQYDAYYRDRLRERPLPVIYVRITDAVGTRYYVDPKTATVVGTYNARNWVNRWLYNGLHSLDFPWLYNYRPLWDIVVISLMLGGTALCVTSLVLTWRVLARTLGRVWGRVRPPQEDLALDLDA